MLNAHVFQRDAIIYGVKEWVSGFMQRPICSHVPMLLKVLACVVCGRLKSAFQIASRSGSVADVQFVVPHQVIFSKLRKLFYLM
ncbi:hypothetical protein GIB67_009046 [Kingdonia uniflora]|uniref:ZFYVE26-like TPR repeats domain-containing protein n=1 Tax=Kingdonia uniflora TaxID=39325 RepID=A0A7J7KY49_9MAGN|nr:hypothetical protein GIB67_009046 [Kingdonia uniflora]